MIIFYFFKVLFLFLQTFVYYFKSLLRPDAVLNLKQQWAQKLIDGFGYRLNISGEAPPAEGPLVLVGNHVSFLDILVLMAAHPKITFVAKKEIRSWPIVGVAAAHVGTLFVDRDQKTNRQNIRLEIATQLEKNKAMLVIFPSGTTSLEETKPWKKGAFEIAKQAGLPVQVFQLTYEPGRESAYIDDDNLVGQMMRLLRIKNKTATLRWLDLFTIENPEEAAEKIRTYLLESGKLQKVNGHDGQHISKNVTEPKLQ